MEDFSSNRQTWGIQRGGALEKDERVLLVHMIISSTLGCRQQAHAKLISNQISIIILQLNYNIWRTVVLLNGT